MSEHTALPWVFDEEHFNTASERETAIVGICADDWVIAVVENDGPNPAADADFILRACNSHDEMVAALGKLIPLAQRFFVEYSEDPSEDMECGAVIRGAKAVLSRAKP